MRVAEPNSRREARRYNSPRTAELISSICKKISRILRLGTESSPETSAGNAREIEGKRPAVVPRLFPLVGSLSRMSNDDCGKS